MAAPDLTPCPRPRLALVSRGDPLTPYLHAALRERYPVAGEVGVELAGWRRVAVAAATFRPRRADWNERYMKSRWGFDLRSRLATRGLAALGDFDAVVQTHALFESRSACTFVYVDCTYHQAMVGWPAWAPQHGRARARWLETEIECYARARHLFAFTNETRRSLIEDYAVAGERITVVGAGMNFAEQQVGPHRRSSRDVEAPSVLFVGKDFARKGCDVLLEAFAEVRRAIPGARLQIVGTGVPGAVPPGVEIVGLVRDRTRMTQLYHDATLFCLPSRFDPSPLVVLEAMAHGLPCVLSDAASQHVPELVADVGTADDGVNNEVAGLRVPAGDVHGLARALLRVLCEPDRAVAYGACAGKVVRERYRWEHVVGRMAPALDATIR